jgi:hypothetical protein
MIVATVDFARDLGALRTRPTRLTNTSPLIKTERTVVVAVGELRESCTTRVGVPVTNKLIVESIICRLTRIQHSYQVDRVRRLVEAIVLRFDAPGEVSWQSELRSDTESGWAIQDRCDCTTSH